MSLSDVQQQFVVLIGQLIYFANAQGFRLTFGDAWASTGHEPNSLHYQRLAVDFNLFLGDNWIQGADPAWKTLGDYWKSLDPLARWGGDITTLVDLNHFSMVPDSTDPRI